MKLSEGIGSRGRTNLPVTVWILYCLAGPTAEYVKRVIGTAGDTVEVRHVTCGGGLPTVNNFSSTFSCHAAADCLYSLTCSLSKDLFSFFFILVCPCSCGQVSDGRVLVNGAPESRRQHRLNSGSQLHQWLPHHPSGPLESFTRVRASSCLLVLFAVLCCLYCKVLHCTEQYSEFQCSLCLSPFIS